MITELAPKIYISVSLEYILYHAGEVRVVPLPIKTIGPHALLLVPAMYSRMNLHVVLLK